VTDSETAADQFGAEVMPPSGGLKMELVVAGSNVRSLGSTAQAFELVRKVVDQSGGRRVDAVVSIGRRSWPVSASLRSDGRTAHLRFTDGSHFSVRDPGATPDESPEPLDVGISLLEPVTVRELRGVEQIIGQLWASVEEAALTETQEAQIILMADLIKAQQVSSNAGQTPRWQIVGAVRSALTYLVREAPKDALAWWKLAELLARIDWHNLAQALPT
jgi:hypothetical protein